MDQALPKISATINIIENIVSDGKKKCKKRIPEHFEVIQESQTEQRFLKFLNNLISEGRLF